MARRDLTVGFAFVLLGFLGACSKSSSNAPATPPPQEVSVAPGQRVPVTVDGAGYHPATIRTHPGAPLTLVFTRTSDEGCGQQIKVPSLQVQRDLPLNQAVEVSVPVTAAGSVAFTCGMDMYRGSVVVQ